MFCWPRSPIPNPVSLTHGYLWKLDLKQSSLKPSAWQKGGHFHDGINKGTGIGRMQKRDLHPTPILCSSINGELWEGNMRQLQA